MLLTCKMDYFNNAAKIIEPLINYIILDNAISFKGLYSITKSHYFFIT